MEVKTLVALVLWYALLIWLFRKWGREYNSTEHKGTDMEDEKHWD